MVKFQFFEILEVIQVASRRNFTVKPRLDELSLGLISIQKNREFFVQRQVPDFVRLEFHS
jgi:hypothetical protein